MKTDSLLVSGILSQLNTPRHSHKDFQRDLKSTDLANFSNSDLWQHQRCTAGRDTLCYSDRESVCSVSTSRSKRIRSRNISMKPLKGGGVNKKSKTMDYTNYAYNEAVGRLKLMLADSYSPTKTATSSYLRSINDDSADNYSDNMSVIDRPVFSDISKYLSPSQKSRLGGAAASSSYRCKKPLSGFSSSKENLAAAPTIYKTNTLPTTALTSTTAAMDYYGASAKPQVAPPPTDSVQAPVEIFNFIEKQEDYIEQLEKESKYCRNELSNLLGKVKDVINENEQLTEHARTELVGLGRGPGDKLTTSPSSDSDEHLYGKSKSGTPRKKEVKSPRYASAPNIVYEARISELEAELMQANIDLKRLKTENEDLKKKLARTDPSLALVSVSNTAQNCEAHRKQIDLLQKDKNAMEETIRHLQKSLDEAKSQQYSQSSKRYINDLVQMERSQAEMEVRHLRDELDRQHERVREMQHEMARRLADERASAERRYNNQVDQLGGDLSSQWEQVAKLQLDLERQKRYESDMKRDLANRNSQIEELKIELRANRSTFLADMAQVNAEKQSLEQEITALRLQLDRASRENKTEAARLNAEINSLRQRLDRADADLLHSKREVLRLNDEIANLEKELAYGEMKNEIRPTKKDLDKRISEMQDKHAETVNELEEMIQNQKQLMDKLTGECKTLTHKLEDTTMRHKSEISSLHTNVEYLTNRMLNSDRVGKIEHTPTSYESLPSTAGKASLDYKPSTFGTTDNTRPLTDDYISSISSKPNPYSYDSILGKTADVTRNSNNGGLPATPTSAAASYDTDYKSKYDTTNYDTSKYDTPTATAGRGGGGGGSGGYDYKTSSINNDNDDENLKDNIGEGEKKQQQQQQLQQQQQQHLQQQQLQQSRDPIAGDTNTNAGDYTSTPQATSLATAGNVGDYGANDYSGYEGYDQQQYDASAYDQTYDQSQYGADQNQYDASGQGYDPSVYDYGASEYDASAYQYDTSGQDTGLAAATPTVTPSTTAAPTTVQPVEKAPAPAPAPKPAAPQPQSEPQQPPLPVPSAAAAAAPSTTATPGGVSPAESRAQPRAGSGTVGPSSAAGSISGGKSNMSQQPSTTTTKK